MSSQNTNKQDIPSEMPVLKQSTSKKHSFMLGLRQDYIWNSIIYFVCILFEGRKWNSYVSVSYEHDFLS